MANILAYTSPAIGHLYPMTALLLELQARGHTIHLRTLSSQVDFMRALGFHTEAIDPRIEQFALEDYKARNTIENLKLASHLFSSRGEIDGPDFCVAASTVGPDVAIVDINTWGAAAAAEASGIPWVSFSPYTPPLFSKGTPPFGPGLAPMAGRIGTVRDALARKLVIDMIERNYLPPINRLRAHHGLGAVTSVDSLFRKAPLMLVTTAKPFEYEATEWGPDVLMIGAPTWEPSAEPPEWLDRIDKPIIRVTTSSEFQNDARLVQTTLEAFRDQPNHVVATIPAGQSPSFPEQPNATVVEFVPHSLVLSRTTVAITHGGMGTTQKALMHGVPVCTVPFGRDQFEVARRVEVSGSGTRLPASKLIPERLRTAVLKAMTMSSGAARVAEGFRTAGGAKAGADAIVERVLNRLPKVEPDVRRIAS